MRRRREILAAATLLVTVGVGAAPASAVVVSAYFEGVMDRVDEGLALDGSVAVGSPFWGIYAYDTEAATDYYPGDGGVGYYSFGTTYTLRIHIGNYDFESNDLGILIWDDVNGEDLYQVASTSAFTSGGVVWSHMLLSLQDFTETALDSDVLPPMVPDLADFETTIIGFLTVPHGPQMVGDLTLLVPEPGTFLLLGFGAVVFMRRRR